jgi:hypothetical protein
MVDEALQEGLTAYAHRQAALRSAYQERAGYLWRLAESWISAGPKLEWVSPVGEAEEKKKKFRNWFDREVKPRCAPSTIFDGVFRMQGEGLLQMEGNDEVEAKEEEDVALGMRDDGWWETKGMD